MVDGRRLRRVDDRARLDAHAQPLCVYLGQLVRHAKSHIAVHIDYGYDLVHVIGSIAAGTVVRPARVERDIAQSERLGRSSKLAEMHGLADFAFAVWRDLQVAIIVHAVTL